MPSGCARILTSSTSITTFRAWVGSGRERAVRFRMAGNFSLNGNRAMRRLLFAIMVWAVTSSQATGQNKISQTLLGLSEDERNQTFTRLLQDNSAKCDRVIRTLFNGATWELDVWEALCRDRNSYSISISPEPNADIELLSCRELLATSKMLLERAGSKRKPTGCKIRKERG